VNWLEHPALKWLLPLPVLALLAWPVWRLFRPSWAALEREALELRQARPPGTIEPRPLAAAILGTAVLALQEYFGNRQFFASAVQPPLADLLFSAGGAALQLATWGELLWECWWGATRIGGCLLPLLLWRLLFPRDRIRDLGLRAAGFREHLWIAALCVAVMVPVLHLAQLQPDFGATYPFYRHAGRSWADFLAWEAIYVAQFLALELFFRGWWIGTSRSFGAGAIFAVAVPYAMIHFGKPYFEAVGALVAGVVLGSLAVRTRSIWPGFLVHSTVAVLMDVAALRARGALPSRLTPAALDTARFPLWAALPWAIWGGAVLVLLLEIPRRRARRRASLARPPAAG
jgi:membrane protease YdiL (CAAX protease family)